MPTCSTHAKTRAGTAAVLAVYGFKVDAVPLGWICLAPDNVVKSANADEKITGQDETVSNLSAASSRDSRADVELS
jgi:hypothetical protein